METDANGNQIKLYWSERNMLRYAREIASGPPTGGVERALANDLVTVIERLGRIRAAAIDEPHEVLSSPAV